MKKIELSKILFFTLLVFIPVNLGKHFDFSGAYVYGNLVDYLVPTLYVQDVLAFALLVSVILERKKVVLAGPVKKLGLFLGLLLISVLFASRTLPSLWFFIRIFLYSFVAVYFFLWVDLKKYGALIQKIFTAQLIFISTLAILQFFMKGSVFDNYLIFGEQPFSYDTPKITKEVFLEKTFLPPMSLFSHPNVLAGYLAVMIIFTIFWIPRNRWSTASFFLAVAALILTFSVFTWLSMLFVLSFYILIKRFSIFRKYKKSLVYFCILIAALMFLPPFFQVDSDNASYYRRDSLLKASYLMAGEFPIFGVGLNNFTSYIDDYQVTDDIRFTQPVHNVFALILAESGILAAFIFILIFFEAYSGVMPEDVSKEQESSKKSEVSPDVALVLSFSTVLLLMSFDHYFWTIHQTSLLLFLLLGFSWKRLYRAVE